MQWTIPWKGSTPNHIYSISYTGRYETTYYIVHRDKINTSTSMNNACLSASEHV